MNEPGEGAVPLPIPAELLVPLVEEAAEMLRALDARETPLSLRHLRGFDRRGLVTGPGRRQLVRTLELDGEFRSQVVERFCARPEVVSTLAEWSVADAERCVEAAADRHDVGLLASALWAAQPEGAEFGLGLIVAAADERRRRRADAETARDFEREVAAADEGRRRAEAARLDAEAEAARVAAELQKERSGRRSREEQAAAELARAQREADDMRAQIAAAGSVVHDERARAERAAKRAESLEHDLKRVRDELERQQREAAARAESLSRDALRTVAEAATDAERLAASLRALERDARATEPEAARPPARPAERVPHPPAPTTRTTPALPNGLVADSPPGLEAMLRTADVVLLIDGYNVTKRAWPEAAAADQRERLGMAATALHRRYRCGVVIVFDGDGTRAARPSLRRGGVRVLFSDADEQADDVVIREVAAAPKRVPVIVASSDVWVRTHAEAEGAVAVGADTLLRVLQRTG